MARILVVGECLKNYTIKKSKLSIGANAISYHATCPEYGDVFLKQYKSPSLRVDWFLPWVECQKMIKERVEASRSLSDQVYKIYDFFESAECGGRSYYQAFEFVTGGKDLKEHLEDTAITWKQRSIFAKLLMSGMKHLGAANIVHSDLKPENLYLIPDSSLGIGYRFKLIDFDRSFLSDVVAPWHGKEGYSSTPFYASPEHLKGGVPAKASDVFTCGLILSELLCEGGHPFKKGEYSDKNYLELINNYDSSNMPELLGEWGSCDNKYVSYVINASLNPDPSKRPTAEIIHKVLLGNIPDDISEVFSGGDSSSTFEKMPSVIRCTGIMLKETGEKVFNMPMIVGRDLINHISGEDAKFSGSEQFKLERDGDSWALIPLPAKNDTFINGVAIDSKQILNEGDVVSVGNRASGNQRLNIRISFV